MLHSAVCFFGAPESMPPAPAAPKKTSKKRVAKKKVAESERAKTGGIGSSKGSKSSKPYAVAIEPPSADACLAVLHRLPPQGPPVGIDEFDQREWLEEQR
jgi:hypothetical protein